MAGYGPGIAPHGAFAGVKTRHVAEGVLPFKTKSLQVDPVGASKFVTDKQSSSNTRLWFPGGCGSKLKKRGYAGFGPCYYLPRFNFGTGFLSHSQVWL